MRNIFGLKKHGNGYSWGHYDSFTNKISFYYTDEQGTGIFDVTPGNKLKQIVGCSQFITSNIIQ